MGLLATDLKGRVSSKDFSIKIYHINEKHFPDILRAYEPN